MTSATQKFRCVLALAVILLPPNVVLADSNPTFHEYPISGSDLNCALGFDKLRSDILDISGIQPVSSNSDFEAYQLAASRTIYTFTKDEHYAHPMIVKRTVYEEGGAVGIETTACGYNTKRNSDRLIKEFQELDQQIARDIRGRD